MELQKQLLPLLPEMAGDILRLQALLVAEPEPTVTVIGKYNHGKSRLLNELVGSDVFAVADNRQTVDLAEYIHEGVRWLDAPGLDADVVSNDDALALKAAWLRADIRLFVHTAKEGELDKSERDLLKELRDSNEEAWRQTLFVLSQTDQLDDEELRNVEAKIRKQVPGLMVYCVSPAMYRKGRDEGKQLLRTKSGFEQMSAALKSALHGTDAARKREIDVLSERIEMALKKIRTAQKERVARLQDKQEKQRQEFQQGLRKVLGSIARSQNKQSAIPPAPII